ncbi:hypothetical protein [Clostridium paraputrificum]|uniref:phage lytic cycle repressor MrpR family protein n=1 Tax=Clostridium paraputrificum TaxID=29363 RepID=UPI00189ECAB7|nr:hypothetical protein [Clostridium paraputrificum]
MNKDLEFVGKPYKKEEERKEILKSCDALMKTKLTYLNIAYKAESTQYTFWRLYIKHIHKVEILFGKDLAYFKDDELETLINKCFNLSEGTRNAMTTFINSYLSWSSTVSNSRISGTKIQSNTNNHTNRRLLKKNLIGLDSFYSMLEEAEKTEVKKDKDSDVIQLHLILPILLFRYGIIGDKASWAINVKYRDVDFDNKCVNIVDENTGELTTSIPIDDRFLKYIDDAYNKKAEQGSVSDDDFILTSAKGNKPLLSTGVYNKVKVFCNALDIDRISPTDLKKSRQLDLMMYCRLKKEALFTSDVQKIAKTLYGDNFSYTLLFNMKKLYTTVTGEEVFTDNRIEYNNINIKNVINNDIVRLAKDSIGFDYNEQYFNFNEEWAIAPDNNIQQEKLNV